MYNATTDTNNMRKETNMSENITTIDAGDGIMVDAVEATPKTKKPARTEAQKQARREKAAAVKAAKIAPVAVEPVEETAAEHNRRELADMEIVSESPEAARVRAATETVLNDAAPITVETEVIITPEIAKELLNVPTIDLATLGMSVALADLADARGMNVSDVITLPELLKGAGLPAEPHGAVVARAAKMQRDSTDAMLWRNNPTARSLAVRLVNGESPTEILAVETRKTATAEPKRVAAAVELDSTPAAAPVATKREPKPQVKRNSAFGHAGVAIVRWLGKHDYSLSDAVAALSRVGITHLSEGTIKVNLCGGKAGRYGGAPELTQEQINQLLGK